jgi:ferredoxin
VTHQLTIDRRYCRGDDLCHTCTAIFPGLYEHCQEHGRLLISHPATGEHGGLLSRLIACCPDRAIVVVPVEE